MLREMLVLFIVLLAGAIAGVMSARWAADHPTLAGAARAGAWQAWPDAGVADAMPYARLRYYLDGALPPSPVDRLELLALRDDDGKALVSDCDYELQGRMLPVRSWIMSVHAVHGGPASALLHAEDAVLEPDGSVRVRLGRQVQPGNWLALPPDDGRLRLVLHLFGISPLERERILKRAPFSIRRGKCA